MKTEIYGYETTDRKSPYDQALLLHYAHETADTLSTCSGLLRVMLMNMNLNQSDILIVTRSDIKMYNKIVLDALTRVLRKDLAKETI